MSRPARDACAYTAWYGPVRCGRGRSWSIPSRPTGVLWELSWAFPPTPKQKTVAMDQRRHRWTRAIDRPRGRVPALRLHLLSILLLPLAGCQDSGLSIGDVRERGFLRAGYSEEAPYSFLDSTGHVTGESPHALDLAAEALGIETIRWIRLDFRDLIPALEQGRVDVVAAGMYRTPDRAQRVLFTRPTACSRPALIMFGSSRAISDPDAALGGAARLAVLAGSVEEVALRRLGSPDHRVLATPDVRTALAAILEDKVDAVAITEPTARWFIRQAGSQDLEVVTYEAPAAVEDLLEACSALAFRPDDESLAASVDSALATVLGSPGRREMLNSLGFSGDGAYLADSPDDAL